MEPDTTKKVTRNYLTGSLSWQRSQRIQEVVVAQLEEAGTAGLTVGELRERTGVCKDRDMLTILERMNMDWARERHPQQLAIEAGYFSKNRKVKLVARAAKRR